MFWEIFQRLCKQHNTSANAVCKELGFSNATPTHWKKGAVPKSDKLSKLADYFGVSSDYLMGKSNAASEMIPEDGLFAQLKTLTDDELKDLNTYVEFLVYKRGHSQDG